ncbi:MAG: DUF167 domain-containing protein [Enhydrobacter sp.]|nr:MAG: DUF167 domain-containing protein [Enhydrobacter sp.]
MAPLNDPAFLRRNPGGVTVELRVRPRARRTTLETSGDALNAAVTAPPEDGRANAAVIVLLAEQWRLPRSAFSVVKGAASRGKVVNVAGAPDMVAGRIIEWVRAHG